MAYTQPYGSGLQQKADEGVFNYKRKQSEYNKDTAKKYGIKESDVERAVDQANTEDLDKRVNKFNKKAAIATAGATMYAAGKAIWDTWMNKDTR